MPPPNPSETSHDGDLILTSQDGALISHDTSHSTSHDGAFIFMPPPTDASISTSHSMSSETSHDGALTLTSQDGALISHDTSHSTSHDGAFIFMPPPNPSETSHDGALTLTSHDGALTLTSHDG